MRPKRKRPLEVPNPKRIDVLVPKEVVERSKDILGREGISLSSYIRRTLNRLVKYPELVLVEMEGVPEVFDEEQETHSIHNQRDTVPDGWSGSVPDRSRFFDQSAPVDIGSGSSER